MVRVGARANPLVDSRARMANIKSQIKRNRQNIKRHTANQGVRSALRTSVKKARTGADDADATQQLRRDATRALDKAASTGVIHKRTAARRKSRLARAANASAG
jgi:small subunit ribosomal protein S20